MLIRNLHIINFRTLENLELRFDGFFTAISGKNNAGKTSVVSVLRELLREQHGEFLLRDDDGINYAEARTQWVGGTPPIQLTYELDVSRTSDPGLYQFLEKLQESKIEQSHVILKGTLSYSSNEEEAFDAEVDGSPLGQYEANEVLKRLRSSTLAFSHNSAEGQPFRFYIGTRVRSMYELLFSPTEREELAKEQRRLQSKYKRLSAKHKSELVSLLGHLEEKYDVDFSIPDGYFARTVPFGINLKDKNVDVPLESWGSGTINRTQILVSILHANRIKADTHDQNRITPVVIIEEPESFLHPSAQAEFGRVLRELAGELEIQTIVTTHSPYMLSQGGPEGNILLDRRKVRGRVKETCVVPVQDKKWMEPFGEILGLNNEAFSDWHQLIVMTDRLVLLVEGSIDKEYLSSIDKRQIAGYMLPPDIEIVPYGGKDALKNTILLKFILDKFEKVMVTFDRDALKDLKKIMNSLNLKEGVDWFAVGSTEKGRGSIEDLVPNTIHSSVYAENPELVKNLGSSVSDQRRSAKSELKRKILEAFDAKTDLSSNDLKGFSPLFRAINRRFR